jgi:hypothetical protein
MPPVPSGSGRWVLHPDILTWTSVSPSVHEARLDHFVIKHCPEPLLCANSTLGGLGRCISEQSGQELTGRDLAGVWGGYGMKVGDPSPCGRAYQTQTGGLSLLHSCPLSFCLLSAWMPGLCLALGCVYPGLRTGEEMRPLNPDRPGPASRAGRMGSERSAPPAARRAEPGSLATSRGIQRRWRTSPPPPPAHKPAGAGGGGSRVPL